MALPPTGRRKRTAPVNSGVMGWVITVHLCQPIGAGRARVAQAQHWTGWCEEDGLDRALKELAAGTHCRIMREAVRLGISWDVASIERGDRNRERQLKQRSTTRRCEICRAQQRLRTARTEGTVMHQPGDRVRVTGAPGTPLIQGIVAESGQGRINVVDAATGAPVGQFETCNCRGLGDARGLVVSPEISAIEV